MTSTSDIAAAVLTKDDVKALRQCDRAIFTLQDGKTTVRCVRETKNPGPFDPKERTYTIEHCDSRVCDYDGHRWTADEGAYACYASAYGGKHNEASSFTTAAALIRPGDHLTLKWVAGNNNDYLRDAGLTHDELYLSIHRGKRTLVFYVTFCAIPTTAHGARMVNRKR